MLECWSAGVVDYWISRKIVAANLRPFDSAQGRQAQVGESRSHSYVIRYQLPDFYDFYDFYELPMSREPTFCNGPRATDN